MLDKQLEGRDYVIGPLSVVDFLIAPRFDSAPAMLGIDISPYKFNGVGGRGQQLWVHVVPIADVYRGQYRASDPQAGVKYARAVGDAITKLREYGRPLCGFIAESCPSVGGQILFPEGYLAAAYAQVRDAGGICIADEVQTAYGRLGEHFYGFEQQRVIPDVVVFGKPIGNGFPLGAVVTTAQVAASFDNGMEFFSTFGGNPVSCAAAKLRSGLRRKPGACCLSKR